MDETFQRLLAQLESRHGALGANLVQFAALLKSAELDVTTAQLLTAGQALLAVGVTRRDDVRHALAASFVTQTDDRLVFDALFDQFWRLPRSEEEPPLRPQPPRLAGGAASRLRRWASTRRRNP